MITINELEVVPWSAEPKSLQAFQNRMRKVGRQGVQSHTKKVTAVCKATCLKLKVAMSDSCFRVTHYLQALLCGR